MERLSSKDLNWLTKHGLTVDSCYDGCCSDGSTCFRVMWYEKEIYQWWSTSTRIHWYRRRAILRALDERIMNEKILRGMK